MPLRPSALLLLAATACTGGSEGGWSIPTPNLGGAINSAVSGVDLGAIDVMEMGSGWSATLPHGKPTYTPAVANGKVFVSGGFGTSQVYALDAATGKPEWGVTVADLGPTAIAVQGEDVIVNTESCTTFSLVASNGEQNWHKWLGDPLLGQPAVVGDTVYSAYPAGGSHSLAAMDLKTGEVEWSVPLDADAIAAPIVSGSDVYVASMAGTVYRLDAGTGKAKWSSAVGATSAPTVMGDRLVLSAHDEVAGEAPMEGLITVDLATGKRQQAVGAAWARTAAPWLDVKVQEATGYHLGKITEDAGAGFARGLPDHAGGEKVKKNLGQSTVAALTEYQGSKPIVAGGKVVATLGSAVVGVDPATGETTWKVPLDGDLRQMGGHLGTPPALASGHLWVATTDGYVLALDPASGEEKWKGDVGTSVRTQPAVVDGKVYVATVTGRIVMMDSGIRGEGDWPMWGGGPTHG